MVCILLRDKNLLFEKMCMSKGGLFVKKNTPLHVYRSKWDLDCGQKRVSIKLKNRHGGCQVLKKMRFSDKFERGFPVRLIYCGRGTLSC